MHKRRITVAIISSLVALLLEQGIAPALAKDNSNEDERQIRALIDATEHAYMERDLTASQAMYQRASESYLVFDIIEPLQDRGTARAWEKTKSFFDSTIGPVIADWIDPTVVVSSGGDLAYVTSLLRFAFTTKDGKNADIRGRSTLVFRRIDGVWTCVHEHDSVPHTGFSW